MKKKMHVKTAKLFALNQTAMRIALAWLPRRRGAVITMNGATIKCFSAAKARRVHADLLDQSHCGKNEVHLYSAKTRTGVCGNFPGQKQRTLVTCVRCLLVDQLSKEPLEAERRQ